MASARGVLNEPDGAGPAGHNAVAGGDFEDALHQEHELAGGRRMPVAEPAGGQAGEVSFSGRDRP
jgi:hypothetical protein